MTRLARIGLYAQTCLYVASGVNHFLHPGFYVGIMPDHYSHPGGLVQLSGAAEILGGVGLAIPATRRFCSFGLTLLLIVFLDVHVFMLRHTERFPDVPRFILWARLPLQGLLIAWVLFYARKPLGARFDKAG